MKLIGFNLKQSSFFLANSFTSRAAIFICTTLLGSTLITSCKGISEESASSPPPVVFKSLQEVTYDLSVATIQVTGNLQTSDATNLTVITFYDNSACSNAPLGQGLSSSFSDKGIQLTVSSKDTTSIYLMTNTSSSCYFLTAYDPLHSPPAPLNFTGTTPQSPSRLSYTPYIFGSISATTAEVRIYADSSCSHLVGTASSSDFAHQGVQVTLQPESTTALYSKTVEPFGNTSDCTFVTSYTHDTSSPSPPLFTSTSPPSPTNITASPIVKGKLSSTSVGITLYRDAACSSSLGTGTKSEFENDGITVLLSSNSSTLIYGQAVNAAGGLSLCTYLTTFIHDDVPPTEPSFLVTNPVSPTRLTLYPKFQGHASSDTATVSFFRDAACINQIGSGTKTQFEGTGILVGILSNNITHVYAQDFDAAGNSSACTFMADYTNDTIAPDLPVFNATNPVSPNNFGLTPYIQGSTSSDTTNVKIYTDEACTQLIASGTSVDFLSPGIQINITPNTTTQIYASSLDNVGNESVCTLMTNYSHSTAAAAAPGFARTVPTSPSNVSTQPWVQGTAATSIVSIKLYNDPSCTTQIGSGNRLSFTTSGVQASVSANSTTQIYGMTTDVYANTSACTLLTSYTHDNIAPASPTYLAITPASPNNVSLSPTIQGTASPDTVTVSLYDSSTCINRIGTGTQSAFTGSGIVINVASNATTGIYAKSFDAATNGTACTFMTNYTHDSIPPVPPTFISATPRTPSYVNQTTILGSSSADSVQIGIYSDASCVTSLGSAPKALFESIGIQISAGINTTTSLYGQASDQVGNLSTCKPWINYVHSNLGPSNPLASQNPNGSIDVTWTPDTNAQSYIVKRSLTSGGPYTIVNPTNSGNLYNDVSIVNNKTYYYVIASQNITGVSNDSAEAQVTTSISLPTTPSTLTATPGPSQIQLLWTGSANALYYSVYRSTVSGGPYTLIASNQPTTGYLDTTVSNDVGYYYVVQSTNPVGKSNYSNEASAVAKGLPSAPINLQLIADTAAGGVRLSWTAPSYYNQFKVKRGNVSGNNSTLATVSGTTYFDSNPIVNTNNQNQNPNYYVVTATWGASESAKSNEVGFHNFNGPTITANAGDGVVILNWGLDTNAADYLLERATVPGGPYTSLGNLTTTTYTDTAVTNGNTYYYRITSNYASDGIPTWPSTEAVASPGTAPSAPSNLVLNFSGGLPVLSWTPSSYYSGFNVYRASSVGGPYALITASPVNSATYTDLVPMTGMNYYKVTTSWGTGETSATNVVSFRNGTPSGLTATSTSTKITLNWNSVSGATNYTLRRATKTGGPYSVISSTAIFPFSDTTVTLGTGYYYVVAANFSDGTTSLDSAEVSGMAGTSTIPSGLSVTNTSTTSVTLSWASVPNSTAYKIYKGTTSGGPYTYIGNSVTTNTYAVSSLTPSTNYYFVVTATVSGVESSQSSEVGARTVAAPTAPLATAGNNSVSLIWSFVSGASTYTLERSTDGVTFSTLVSGLVSTSYTDSTAVNGTLYFYRFKPIFSSASITSLYSPASSAITPGIVPRTPTGLLAITNSSGTSVDLTWGAVTAATAYNVKISSVSGGPYTNALSGTTSNPSTVNSLTSGVPVYFVVSALNGSVESGNSAEIAVIPLLTPTAPTGSVDSLGQVNLTWTPVAGANSYDILRSTDAFTYLPIATSVLTSSYTDTTVVSSTTYRYKYIPRDASGVGMATSGASSALTPGILPLSPTNLVGNATSSTSIQLSWIPVPGAVSYNVKRGTASGGPYSTVFSSAVESYTDSSVIAGTDYFYVATAVNSSGVESGNSNEVGFSSLSAPASLNAVNGANSINLSWGAVGGASSYTVKRGLSTGGPYSIVATGVAATNYSDTNIENGVTYYYVVVAKAASGAVSPNSSEVSINGIVTMNIQVPIELTDQSMNSDTVPVTFNRTETSFDPTLYDGTITYFFEAVAINTDAAPQNAYIVDSSGITVATLTVPGSTSSATRVRSAFTPNPVWDTYRIKLDGTPTFGELQILSARMIVNQVGATMTRLYIPLLASSNTPSSADQTAAIEQTFSTTYTELPSASIYKRNSSVLSQLPQFEAWELETLVSAAGGATGAVALYNSMSATAVDDTEATFNETTITMINSPFDEGITGFSSLQDTNEFQVSIRCQANCSGGSARIFKAGLWVSLTNLNKAEVYYRNGLALPNLSSLTQSDVERTQIDLTAFSNPVIYFQANAMAPSGGNLFLDLMTTGTNDTGYSTLSSITNSTLQYTFSNKTWMRSNALTINSSDRFVIQANPDMPTASLIDSTIVVRATR